MNDTRLMLILSSASSPAGPTRERVLEVSTAKGELRLDKSTLLGNWWNGLIDHRLRPTMLLVEFVANCPCCLDDPNTARGI